MSECEVLTCSDKSDPLKILKNNLNLEFCWIIELLNINIYLNDKKLDYSNLIEEITKEETEINTNKFNLKFIKWSCQLKDQSSRYYFLNSNGIEMFVKTTTLNNKGDDFYHSLYISSPYFDDFNLMKTPYEEAYKGLMEYIQRYLRDKRSPFIKQFSKNKYEEFEKKDLLPKFNKFEIEIKKPIYEEIVREIIEFAPSLASNSNENQKKILLQLMYL